MPEKTCQINESMSQQRLASAKNYTDNYTVRMKGQEIAYLPKFANIMLIVMVIVINEIF